MDSLNNTNGEQPKKRAPFSLSLVSPSYVLPVSYEVKTSGGYLTYGADNLYPQYLWKMYTGSALHGAIINRKQHEIVANGLYSKSKNKNIEAFLENCNELGESFQDVFEKIVLDYLVYGGFMLEIIRNRAGDKISGIIHADYAKYRYDDTANKLKYAKYWDRYQRVKVATCDIYNPKKPVATSFFVYNGKITRDWYAIPEYIGALPYVEAQCEIANYNLQTVKNGMAPSMLVSIKNGSPTQEERDSIEAQIIDKFTGSSNAGAVMVDWSDTDTPNTTITPIEQNDANDRYLAVQEATISNIFTGHQITTPSIFGQQQSGKLGIATEYAQGLQIFQITYVKPNQQTLLRILNKLLEVNFPNCDLDIMPLEPVDMYFTDEVLIASQMTQTEIRQQLVKQGILTNADLPADEKPISEQDIIPKLDTTDKEVAAGPGANKNGADADEAGDNTNGQN